jgi:F420-non-reducing hydrogenase large subunit
LWKVNPPKNCQESSIESAESAPGSTTLASNKAVDRCFDVTPPPAGRKLRELMQTISHAKDKLLHLLFLAAADFVIGPDSDYAVRM